VIVGLLLLCGCGRMMKSSERVPSPSGTFVVVAIPNDSKVDPTKYRCLRLVLEHRNGNSLAGLQTSVSDGQKWALGWMESGDVVVLQSSDIGTLAFNVMSNTLMQIQTTPAIEKRAIELKTLKYGK